MTKSVSKFMCSVALHMNIRFHTKNILEGKDDPGIEEGHKKWIDQKLLNLALGFVQELHKGWLGTGPGKFLKFSIRKLLQTLIVKD